MNYFSLFPFTAFIVNVFLSAYVLRENPRGKLNRIYAAFAICLALWSLAVLAKTLVGDSGTALAWERVEEWSSTLATLFMLHFTLAFSGSRLSGRKPMIPIYAIFVAIALLTQSPLVTNEMELKPWGYMAVEGPLFAPLIALLFLTVIIPLPLCLRMYLKSKPGKEKQQAKFVTAGFGFLITVSVLCELVPAIGGPEIPPYSTASTGVLAALIAYAILRYRLMSLTPAIAAERIIETMADYLVVADKEKKIAFTSKSAGNALGYRKDEMAGKDVSMVFAGKGTPDEIIGKLSKSEYVGNVEAEALDKKGGKIPVSVNATIVSGGGETLGYVLLMHDMRETKKLIKGMEEKTKLLESRTAELELSKKKLETQITESERLNKLAVGRELKMVELKKRISTLEAGKG